MKLCLKCGGNMHWICVRCPHCKAPVRLGIINYHAGVLAACLAFACLLCAGSKRKRPDLGAYTEKTKVDKVSIVVLPDGHVQAMLPMVLSAEQETGPAVPSRTVLNCK